MTILKLALVMFFLKLNMQMTFYVFLLYYTIFTIHYQSQVWRSEKRGVN